MEETMIEELFYECKNHDIIAHNCYVTDENLKIIKTQLINMQEYINKDIAINEILMGKSFPAGMYFMTKKTANYIYPLDSDIIYEDWYIYMKLALRDIKIKFLDKSLGMYRQVPNSDYGGVSNFNKKIYKYRAERDIKMLDFFINILPLDYVSIAEDRISIVSLSINGNIFNILTAKHPFKVKIRIIVMRYFYWIYHIYAKLKFRKYRN
jgi:hypothetical protein